MAIALVNLKFGVNLTEYMTDLNKVIKENQKFGRQMQAVGKNLTTYVTAPLAAIAGLSVKMSSDFDDSMRKVQATSSATSEEFDILKKKALEMGSSTKFTASESAEAMNYMAMAGWKTTDIMEGLSGVMMGAAASGESLGLVSDIVTDGLTAFGLSAKDSNTFVDVLASAASNANTNIAMLGESFKYAAPVAGALGYSVGDVSVALGLMANAGIKGSQSGTALRAILSRLVKPTKESEQAMKDLGISAANADGTMKPFSQVMEELRTAFSKLTPEQKAMYAGMIGGQEAMSGLLAITGASIEDFTKLSTAIDNSEGSAKRMSETMEGGLGGAFRSLRSAVEGVMIQLGDILTPVVIKLTNGLKGLVQWFGNLSTTTKVVITVIGALVAAIGPFLTILGVIVANALPAAIAGFKALGVAVTFATGPIGAALIIVGTLTAALVYFASKSTLSVEAAKKQETALENFKLAADKAAEAQQILNDLNQNFHSKSPEVVAQMKEQIKARIEETKAILAQAQANHQLAIEEAKKESLFDIIVGFERVQRRVNKVQKEGADEISKINKTLNDLTLGYLTAGSAAEDLNNENEDGKKTVEELRAEFDKLADAKNELVFSSMADEAKKFNDAITESQRLMAGIASGSSKIIADEAKPKVQDIDIPGLSAPPVVEVPQIDESSKSAFMASLNQFSTDISTTINDTITTAFVSMGDAIGTALASGTNVLSAAGSALLGTLAGMLGQLGQMAVAAGVAVLGIQVALKSLNPYVAIAAGVALIALSSVIKGRMKSMGSTGGGGGGDLGPASSVQPRAGGGRVLGGHDYMVGENGPEVFRAGMTGTVIPNHKLGGSQSSMQTILIKVESMLRGQDIYQAGEEYVRVSGRTT